MRVSTPRVRVCSGGSASRSRLGGRHGGSLRKLLSPAPAEEQKVCQSECHVHLLVPRHPPAFIAFEPDHWTGLAQLFMEGIGVAKKFS